MNIRLLIAVPTFDNDRSIAAVVQGLAGASAAPILVVDDGSRIPAATTLTRAGLVVSTADSGGSDAPLAIHVVRHPHNRGKGTALKTAFAWALAQGYTHVLSVDGDGQHLASQVARLAAAAAEHPWSLIVGARRFAPNVPTSSRFGRAFSNFWVRYETGVAVVDSQSGMRVYPIFYLQSRQFLTTRYEFEVEIITRLLWAGVAIVDVEIEVHYPPAGERVTHLRPMRDNARIALLNVALVVVALTRRHVGAGKLALVTLLAPPIAFLGWPLGTRLALLVLMTVLLRLNALVALAWLAVSLAAVPLLVTRFAIDFSGTAWPWVPLTAAAVAGLVRLLGGLLARRGSAAWTGKWRGTRFGHGLLHGLSRRLGLGATYVCLAVITPYFYLFAPRARRSSLEYLRAVRPRRAWWRRRFDVVAHFFTFGMVLLDRLYQSCQRTPAFDVRVVGRPLFEAAAREGRGVIILTAHAGGWGLSTEWLATEQLGRDSVIAEFVADGGAPPTADQTRSVTRASAHNEAVPILAYKELLEQGRVVGMMGDRPLSDKLALVPFLGKLAAFDLTPFRLGQALGADVLYCFAFKTGYKSYELTLEASLPLGPPGAADRHQRSELALRHFAAALATKLRRHPRQWFNFYPFFSTRPAAPWDRAAR